MAESDEHRFLSATFLETLDQLSRSRLYGYTEADRKLFDFGCLLERDWTRPLVGQTLWSHVPGVDKDLRSLLTADDAEVWAYVARDTVQSRSLIGEAVRQYAATQYRDQLHRLRVFWIPSDFDADSEEHQRLVRALLWDRVSQDILLNVVFGNLSSDDIRFFLSGSGIIGLQFATLYAIATFTWGNYVSLATHLSVSRGPVREKILTLLGTGFIWSPSGSALYFVTLKGRVFLEICRALLEVELGASATPELRHLLTLLGLDPHTSADPSAAPDGHPLGRTPHDRLLAELRAAVSGWPCDLAEMRYVIHDRETDRALRIQR
jgi:hypothetical protein